MFISNSPAIVHLICLISWLLPQISLQIKSNQIYWCMAASRLDYTLTQSRLT